MSLEDGADRIQRARLEKLERLEAAGLRAYPTTFARTHKAAEVQADFAAQNDLVALLNDTSSEPWNDWRPASR